MVGATAAVLQRRMQQQQGAPAPQRRESGGGPFGGDGPGFRLAWPLPDKDQQLIKTVREIERLQERQAVRDMRRWDERFRLRTKPLTELRAMAQRHGIAGRSRMRKPELVAALELALGLAVAQPGRPAAGP